MKTLLPLILLAAACAPEAPPADAYGNFEAREIVVSAETGGRILHLSVREGDALEQGQAVGQIDTVQLALSRAQLQARAGAVRARFPGIAAQAQVLETQRTVSERERDRLEGLVADGAATTKQLDDVVGALEVLEQQIASIRTGNAPLFAELDVLSAQDAVMADQLRRATITNPVGGTVLETYAEQSELTAPGRPLYRVAALDTLELRAYISGAQLPDLRLGQDVRVVVDGSGADRGGRVSWIASESEFTPKLIQTREERVALVYAFKVQVPNPDGALKIGMPGEVNLNRSDG